VTDVHAADAGWSPAAPPVASQPTGYPAHRDAVSLHGPRFQGNPVQAYRELRARHGAVAPVMLEGEVPAWLVLGYRELHYVTSNSELFSRDSRRWNLWDRIPADWPLLPLVGYRPSVLYADGAEHQRRSGALHDVLSGVDQFELRARCERIADGLVDSFAGRGEAELMNQYAHQVPLLAMTWLLGIPEAETPPILRDTVVILDNGADAMAAHGRVFATMGRLLARCRERPGSDVTSRLTVHPAELTDEEIVEDLMVLSGAGQQPTAYWIGNTLRLMLTDSRFEVTLSGGRRSIGQALNEVLWEDTPNQRSGGRWAVRTMQLGGQRIQAGDMVLLGFAAANADPQIRPDPAAGASGNQAHMSFSHGDHRCPFPAQEFAEIIAKTAVEVLLDRLPDVVLAVPPDALVWRPSMWLRGLSALPVEFSPI
jgi:cytochrome P450